MEITPIKSIERKSKDAANTSAQNQVNAINGREIEEGQTFQY
jgi:hypothetical protein